LLNQNEKPLKQWIKDQMSYFNMNIIKKELFKTVYFKKRIIQTKFKEKKMSEIVLTDNDREQIIQITKAIASETRYSIVKLLAQQEHDISRLAEALGQTEANISAQVKQLEKAKLIESRYEPGNHGVRKICRTTIKKVTIMIS
jgi:DNA-binding transcriptional ArsR family regulator